MKNGIPDDFLVRIAKIQTKLSSYVKKRDELPNTFQKSVVLMSLMRIIRRIVVLQSYKDNPLRQ